MYVTKRKGILAGERRERQEPSGGKWASCVKAPPAQFPSAPLARAVPANAHSRASRDLAIAFAIASFIHVAA